MANIINEAMNNNNNNFSGNKQDVPRAIRERDLCVGSLVLAPYVDEEGIRNYYRARVQFKSNLGKCLVYFIDYGNSDWVSNRELFDLSPNMIERGLHTTPAIVSKYMYCPSVFIFSRTIIVNYSLYAILRLTGC